MSLGENRPGSRVLTFSFKLDQGKFIKDPGTVVGRVKGDGRIEGTNLRVDPKKYNGGVAISTNSSLVRGDGDTLINSATGEVFAKSPKGYFNKDSGTFIRVWGEVPPDEV